MIQPIIEGDGEVEAVTVLLRRLNEALGIYGVAIGKPIKQNRTELVKEDRFKVALELASFKPNVQAVFVVFDLDDDCARDIVPRLKRWANEQVSHLPCGVVLARREYEAWLLAAIESLRGVRGIAEDAVYPANPEAKRDAKGELRRMMPKKHPYSPTADQAALSARIDLGQAYRRSSSFRKLVATLCQLLAELGYQSIIPSDWTGNIIRGDLP